MQELLVGSWGPQIAAYGRHVVAYSLQYPWRVFAACLVATLLVDMMSRKRSSAPATGSNSVVWILAAVTATGTDPALRGLRDRGIAG